MSPHSYTQQERWLSNKNKTIFNKQYMMSALCDRVSEMGGLIVIMGIGKLDYNIYFTLLQIHVCLLY